MEPEDIANLAERIHNEERYDLGASSTREYRNEFWARVLGIVHFGHSKYNPRPDNRWHLKSGGNGRPQSDDVAVLMPERHFWDFIVGVGANGYRFQASGDHGVLPAEQPVFPPPKPQDSGTITPPPPPNPPTDYSQQLQQLQAKLDVLKAIVAGLVDQVKNIDTSVTLPDGLMEALAQHQQSNADLKASIDELNKKFDQGFTVEGKAGWPVGKINATVSLRDL